MVKRKLTENDKLFKKAQQFLVGGVNSPVRSFNYVGGKPVLIKSGSGSKVYDYDGNEYIDYVLSWGAMILGHAHPIVTKDIKKALDLGLGFGTTSNLEIELAQIINQAIPFMKKIRFVTSGTEAVMSAVRLARGYTERDKILKFENSYHGHADYLLAKAGSGLATLQIPLSKGVPKEFIKHTLIAPFGDIEAVERLFKEYGNQLAAVLVEPIVCNNGVQIPIPDFLKKLRQITKKYKTLLIFDEIITGFRFNFGSVATQFDIIPDLICLGKIIGGGLPVGAYGGKEKIMKYLAPLGKVYQAATFSGNPVVMQSGLSTIKALAQLKKDYVRINELTNNLSFSLESEALLRGINFKVDHFGSAFSLSFQNKKQFKLFHKKMLGAGIFFAPSEFEANFLSFAHDNEDINKTLIAAKAAFDYLKKTSHGR